MYKERIIIIIFNEGTRMDINIIKWFPFWHILALWIKVHSSPVHLRILVPRAESPATGLWALVVGRGGKWAGWVINGLGHKWVGCIITHLSIYDPFIYKLIIHYQPNPFN